MIVINGSLSKWTQKPSDLHLDQRENNQILATRGFLENNYVAHLALLPPTHNQTRGQIVTKAPTQIQTFLGRRGHFGFYLIFFFLFFFFQSVAKMATRGH